MRIVCHSIDDFLENLKSSNVHRRIVHASMTTKAEGNKPVSQATSVTVFGAFTAILSFTDGGSALLEYMEECGVDRTSAPATSEGTDRYNSQLARLRVCCDANGLTIMPGVIDF